MLFGLASRSTRFPCRMEDCDGTEENDHDLFSVLFQSYRPAGTTKILETHISVRNLEEVSHYTA
jgi:hypothetical protein